MLCFVCEERQAVKDRVLCGECLRRELAQAVALGRVGEGFMRMGRRKLDHDTFAALEGAGLISVDLLAQIGVTHEEAMRFAQGENRSKDREDIRAARRLRAFARDEGFPTWDERAAARLLLVSQETLAGMLQLAYPLQSALGIIWYPTQAGLDPSQDDQWRAALDFVVGALPWKIHNKDGSAWQELRRRAAQDGREVQSVKQDELRTALLLALALFTPEERRIRLEGEWYTVAPTRLKWKYAWHWVCNETIKIAGESLRGYTRTAGDQRTSRGGEALALLAAEEADAAAPEGDPLYRILHREQMAKVLDVLHKAPPREREVVRLLLRGMSRTEAAQAMGISESTLRVHLHRFVKRIQAA
jgi:RNA polymerase sigma factor (sigma-70 family)